MVVLNPFSTSTPTTISEVSDLRIYPIKSCRGISLTSSTLTRQGLDLDRRWMFADAEKNHFITIRQISKMTLINTALTQSPDGSEHLQISISGTDNKVSVPARPSKEWLDANTQLKPVKIWDYDTDGYVYGEEINKFFSEFLEQPVVLVYKGPTPRIARGNASKKFLGREETVNFPDVMPILIVNEASIRELNSRLRTNGSDSITIERFRPNIIVKGSTHLTADGLLPGAWSEDNWKTVRISPNDQHQSLSSYLGGSSNDLIIDIAARCTRCQVPNVDPDTAEKNEKQPWDLLVSYRRIDEGMKYKPCFGMLSCPRNEGPISVGMRFEVVQTTEAHYYQKGF